MQHTAQLCATLRPRYVATSVVMQRYQCNVDMVFSGQMNNIIECDFIRSTDCMHAALANLLFELICLMVRDGVLSLPTWFSRDLIDGVLSSVCV